MALICNVCISKEKYRKNLKKQGNWLSKKVLIQNLLHKNMYLSVSNKLTP